MHTSLLSAAFLTTFARLATALSAQTEFDTPPAFKAEDLLRAPYLTSPHHQVRSEVKTYNGLNHYVVDSPFGTFVAHGNLMLQERVGEVLALARLREMSNGSEHLKAVKEAAKAPLNTVTSLVQSPGETLVAVPQGVGKFIGRIGRGVQEKASGREQGQGEDGLVKSAAGVSKTKRELSRELGVNPYTSNEVLQEELDRVAWVAFAGKMTITAATAPVGGAAGTALSAISAVDVTNSIVYEQSPLDLRKANLARLQAMGVEQELAESFLANPAFSPWHQSRTVASLQLLAGVQDRAVFVRDAATMTNSEADAVFYQETARLMAHAHTHGIPVAKLTLVNGFPVCVTADGALMVALHWDHAMWSPGSQQFAKALEEVTLNGAKPSSLIVVLTGTMSPRLRQELEGRGFRVQDRLIPGPLK